MRGARQDAPELCEGAVGDSPGAGDEVLQVLQAIRDEVARLATAQRSGMPEDTL
jgi:hypothetical protein